MCHSKAHVSYVRNSSTVLRLSPFPPIVSLARDDASHAHICANDYKRVNVKSEAKRSLHPPKSVACSRTQVWIGLIQSLDAIRPISPITFSLSFAIHQLSLRLIYGVYFIFWRILRWWKTDLFCFSITLTVALSQSRQGRNCFNILSVSVCWWNTFVLQECGHLGWQTKEKINKNLGGFWFGTLTKTAKVALCKQLGKSNCNSTWGKEKYWPLALKFSWVVAEKWSYKNVFKKTEKSS